jgi:putative transposase
VIETALGAELTDHPGHEPGGIPAGSNVRNVAGRKTVATDLGPVPITAPRDCDGRLSAQARRKRQTQLAGSDDKILGLYAGGMIVRDISAHPSERYGAQIGRDTISAVIDAVLADARRTRPLEAVYPIAYFDAMQVRVREDRSVRDLVCDLASGVTCDGRHEVPGIWWQETDGATFWLAVLNDLAPPRVQDALIVGVDGLKGLPEAIEATFPQTGVQPCPNADQAPSSSALEVGGAAHPATVKRGATPRSTSSRSSCRPNRCAVGIELGALVRRTALAGIS